MPEKSPTEVDGAGGVPPPPPAKKRRVRRTGETRVPGAADAIQVNACRNPNCANFGVPAKVDDVPHGRRKGHKVVREFPPPTEASCKTEGCPHYGQTLAEAPEAYAPDRHGWTPWSQRWKCRACKKTIRTRVEGAPPVPEPSAAGGTQISLGVMPNPSKSQCTSSSMTGRTFQRA